MSYTAICTYEGNLRTQAVHQHSGQELHTDAPKDNQGRGEAFSPTDLVAAALASCMLTVMGIAARDLGRDMAGTTVSVKKTMGSGPRRIVALDVLVEMAGEPLSDEEFETLKAEGLACPVAQSLHPDLQVTTAFRR